MAADLRGDLLGTATDLNASDTRWLSPLSLWTGILAGPIVWSIDLLACYALVKWACLDRKQAVIQLILLGSLAVVAGGAIVSWIALQHTPATDATDGGDPKQRARFMALLGLASSALFALTIVALAIPHWVLDACQ